MTGLFNRISVKINLAVIAVMAVIMLIFNYALVEKRAKVLEDMVFTKARTLVLVGAESAGHILEDLVDDGILTTKELFDVDYQPIVQGPLAGSSIPKYHTKYDEILDQKLLPLEDTIAEEDSTVVFAALVDRNGYLPVHNSRYAKPLTGNPEFDLNHNRTKRIFDDPVGLAAARFEGTGGQKVLRQVYKRDTGEIMWDVSAPVLVHGHKWGSFRIGLSIEQTRQAIIALRNSVTSFMLLMLAAIALTNFLLIQRLIRPLKQVTAMSKRITEGDEEEFIAIESNDEVGTLVTSFNKMIRNLRETTVSRNDLDDILRSMNDALLVTDLQGRVLLANRAAANLLQTKVQDVLQRPVQEFLQRVEGSWGDNQSLFAADQGSWLGEMLWVAEDGSKIPVDVSCAPLTDSLGDVKRFILVAKDISIRKQTEEQLKGLLVGSQQLTERLEEKNELLETNRSELEAAYAELKNSQSIIFHQEKMASLGQLAAGVAHEVNNPIGFVNSNLGSLNNYLDKFSGYMKAQQEVIDQLGDEASQAELAQLRRKLKLDYVLEDSRDLIQESLEGTDRVRRIVQGLKSFARMDDSEMVVANINEQLENTINIVWNEIKYKAVLHRQYGSLPTTRCYPQRLNQVFMNLLVNAAQAIEKQGEIRVKTWCKEGTTICVAITDSGCGIPPENQSRIFEPFFTTKEVGVGTGLGMSIAYEIIQQHKGHVKLESVVGQGTTFTIELPVVSDEEAAAEFLHSSAQKTGN